MWFDRSRRFCHRRQRGAPHEIDKTKHVGRLRVAAPGDMLVRTHQHEPVAIERRCLARSHVKYSTKADTPTTPSNSPLGVSLRTLKLKIGRLLIFPMYDPLRYGP